MYCFLGVILLLSALTNIHIARTGFHVLISAHLSTNCCNTMTLNDAYLSAKYSLIGRWDALGQAFLDGTPSPRALAWLDHAAQSVKAVNIWAEHRERFLRRHPSGDTSDVLPLLNKPIIGSDYWTQALETGFAKLMDSATKDDKRGLCDTIAALIWNPAYLREYQRRKLEPKSTENPKPRLLDIVEITKNPEANRTTIATLCRLFGKKIISKSFTQYMLSWIDALIDNPGSLKIWISHCREMPAQNSEDDLSSIRKILEQDIEEKHICSIALLGFDLAWLSTLPKDEDGFIKTAARMLYDPEILSRMFQMRGIVFSVNQDLYRPEDLSLN